MISPFVEEIAREVGIKKIIVHAHNAGIDTVDELKRMEEYDVEKIIISSHLGARPSHQLWQGKVFTAKNEREHHLL